MNAAVISEIRRYAVQGRIKISGHARGRMNKRNVDRDDIRHALCIATTCRPSADGVGRWEVPGVDLSGDALLVVVVIEFGVLVVTVY